LYLRALPPCGSESHTRAMRYLYARDGVWRVHTKACSRLKRLKTGVQWKELPIEVYFEKGEISWQNVYYYFNKWSKDGSFQHPRNGEQPDVYFDEELYKNRFKIEQTNGWLDGYKGLIMRYEYLDVT